MKAQKLFIAGLAALTLLLFVAQVDSFAKLTQGKTDALRQGKGVYATPSSDEAALPEKGQYRGGDALPSGKGFQVPALQDFFSKIIDIAFIGYQDFRDFVRLPRSVKYKGSGSAGYRYFKILAAE
ncbi:MAG TPA: hypothetical protein VGD14_06305 [bacterium]